MLFILVVMLLASVEGTPILGGRDAGGLIYRNGKYIVQNPATHPYIAYLEIIEILFQDENVIKRGHTICGGVIVTQDVILTAAHCLTHCLTEPTIKVRAGMVHRTLEEDTQFSIVKDYKIHDDYTGYHPDTPGSNMKHYHNDIALLWLKTELFPNRKVQLATLADETFGTDYKKGIIAGWGQTDNGQESDMLQESEVKVVSNRYCNIRHKPFAVIDSMVCTISYTNTAIQCMGDSGGPLVVNGLVIGIASWAEEKYITIGNETVRSCNPRAPGVFTRVSKYRDWIRDNLDLGPPKERNSVKLVSSKKCKKPPSVESQNSVLYKSELYIDLCSSGSGQIKKFF